MQTDPTTDRFFQSKVLGHPAGLFVLFFTEMWERFSFYGMRVLLVLFLMTSFVGTNPGWEFSSENAYALYGTYAGLLYLTPILGGVLADRYLGFRLSVVIGALIMTLGHACMALETEFSLYLGLGLLVVGTGFFKPNITSIISQMYKDLPKKKDGAYTIFYMGVNAGAFFGMMLCGYIGEKIGWNYGFGLAGIFMLFGAIQFWLSKPLFGEIGDKPVKQTKEEKAAKVLDYVPNKFTQLDKVLIVLTALVGFIYLINDPLSKIAGIHLLPEVVNIGVEFNGPLFVLVVLGLLPFLYLSISRILRYDSVVMTRMFAVIIFAIFTVFFFLSFEQGATTLVTFADMYTDRSLDGNAAIVFNVVNILLTLGPLVIISFVLYRLFRETWSVIKWSNIILGLSFIGVWILAIWMLNRDLHTKEYNFQGQMVRYQKIDEETGEPMKNEETGEIMYVYEDYTDSTTIQAGEEVIDTLLAFKELHNVEAGTPIKVVMKNGEYDLLDAEEELMVNQQLDLHKRPSPIIRSTSLGVKSGAVQIPASWFSILNSFFIIAFASFFSRWWESKYNPSPAMKYALGLIIMGVGFGVLAYGSIPIGDGTSGVRVGIIWLILAYFFHTLGELCVSPVGLSMVSKLVPGRMIAFMFGMWYLAIAIGQKLAASLGGTIEGVVSKYDMTTFYLIFTIVPALAGVLIMFLNPVMKKLMKGVQ